MNNILHAFLSNIEALQVYVESVEPILQDKSREVISQNKELSAALMYSLQIFLDCDSKQVIEKKDVEKDFDIVMDEEKKSVSINLKPDSNIELSKMEDFIKRIRYSSQHEDILYKSSLMNLVIYLESMISEIFRIHFNEYPDSIVNKKSLTFEEIKAIGSIEEASNYIVEKEIENKMYGTLNDWCEFMKKHMKLDIYYLDHMKDEITEIIARRNIFVHNQGIVNQMYLSKVADKYKSNVSLNTELKVDREYIDRAIEVIEEFGILLIIEVLLSKNRNNIDGIKIIEKYAFESMCSERWSLSMKIYDMLLNNRNLKNIPAINRLQYKVNYWQSLKWLGRYSEIKSELEKEDFSANTKDFQLCIHALKDEYDEFYDLLERIYEKDICKESLESWPIFREIRKQSRYRKFIDSKGI